MTMPRCWVSQGLTIEDIFGEDLEISQQPERLQFWDVWENQYTRQYAIYADASYAFTDQWKLDIGVRESKIIYTFAEYIAGSQWFAPGSASYGQNKQPSFTPKASLNFQLDPNDLYYFTYARGFRSGGANAPIPEVACAEDFGNLGITGTPLTYNSDTTDSFEVGAKNNVANRLQLATSVYWIKWNAIQQFAYLPICGLGFVENLGQAVSKGSISQGDLLHNRQLDARTSPSATPRPTLHRGLKAYRRRRRRADRGVRRFHQRRQWPAGPALVRYPRARVSVRCVLEAGVHPRG